MSGQCLKRLVGAVHTLPVSTAECERGFSRMNIISTPLRTCLAVKHISALFFISIAGPPLNRWQPLPYVKSWLAKGRHAATDLGKGSPPGTIGVASENGWINVDIVVNISNTLRNTSSRQKAIKSSFY